MQQVLVIHGGNAFNTYEEYLTDLRQKVVSLEDLQRSDWKRNLSEYLGTEYEVLSPRMPNGQNAKYTEWKIWFAKFVPLLQPNPIFIGHSLGGIFLAKYLAEETMPYQVRATFLVAAPYNTPDEHPLADFVITSNLKQFEQQGGHIFLYHSQDDQVVPFSNFERYQQQLPQAQTRIFTDRQHFNQPELPELVRDIQTISASRH